MSFSYPKPIGKVKCWNQEDKCPICQGTGICHNQSGSGAFCISCNGTGDIKNHGRKLRSNTTSRLIDENKNLISNT